MKFFCQYMGCSNETDWVNIVLAVIKGTLCHITYFSLMLFIAYTFKGQVHVFARRVKILSHSSCRTSAILDIFVPCKQKNFRRVESKAKIRNQYNQVPHLRSSSIFLA